MDFALKSDAGLAPVKPTKRQAPGAFGRQDIHVLSLSY